jgi:YD repeat-containing protein
LPNNKHKLYINSDNSYWFRYFDNEDKLYNVFIYKPNYIGKHELPLYRFDRIELHPGDNGSTAFKLIMKRDSGNPSEIALSGFADFKIGNSLTLNDVLLRNLHYNPQSLYAYNCEREKLNAAIYEGKVRYIHYYDSIRTSLIDGFTQYVLQGFSESLVSSYKTQRFNYTVYEYDRAQNLIRTVPPAGVSFLPNTIATSVNVLREADSISNQYLPAHSKSSTYEYNSLNQVVRQNTPDGGKTLFFYDKAGRAVFSQNAKQRDKGYMTYTLYDEQSRIVETGQAKIACVPFFEPYSGNDDSLLNHTCANNVGGIITPFPAIVQDLKSKTNQQVINFVRSFNREEVVYTHYDNAVATFAPSMGFNFQENLRKRVAAIKYFAHLTSADTALVNYEYAMHFSYDIAGNVKTLTRDYPSWAPAGQRFKRIDYDYDQISGKVNLLSYNRGFADQFYQKYDYDDDNRIKVVSTSADGIIWNRDAQYEYYQHGPLARMSLGNERVQGVDYAYTIQGWLKAINGDILDPSTDMGSDDVGNSAHGRDAVALSIDYFNGDYKPIGNKSVINTAPSIKNLYNGNIPKTTVAIKPFEQMGTDYIYDQLNRLMKAEYATLGVDTTWQATNQYKNSYAYDPDGNIQKLVRNGNNLSTLAMDSIIYHYTVGNTDNRLQNVNDYVADNYTNDIKQNTINNVARYMYDPTGNLIKDLVSGQDTIQWNNYNKVTKVIQYDTDTTELRFNYDGSGQRYMKTTVKAINDTTVEKGQYYVRDAQGNILAVYDAETRYELSPTTVYEHVILPLIASTGSNAFLYNYVIPYFGNNALAQNYFVEQGAALEVQNTLLTEHGSGYFISNSAAVNLEMTTIFLNC